MARRCGTRATRSTRILSMLNTALANALLLAAELCFWYQLSHVRHEWAEMQYDLQTNRSGAHRTDIKRQQLVMPAGQIALPRTQNATHVLMARLPLPSIIPMVPVLLLWLQSLVYINYSYKRMIDSTVTLI